MADGSKYADRLIDFLRISSRADLLLLDEICWARHILIKDDNLEGAEARLVTARGQGIITVSTDIHDYRRRRFSIAHELGHFEMHRGEQGVLLCTSNDIRQEGEVHARQAIEQEANEFASAFVLPARFIGPLCKKHNPSLEFVAEIAESFSTSVTATALLYLQFCDEPVAIIFSKDRCVQWFHESIDFKKIREDLNFFFDVRARVDPVSLASRLFEDPGFPMKNRRVPASAWFTHGKYREDAIIQECSLPMPNYNAVLTLLWINEEIDDEEEDDW